MSNCRTLGLSTNTVILAIVLVSCTGSDDVVPPAIAPCSEDPRMDNYASSTTAVGQEGKYELRIDAVDPAPPMVGSNLWTVSLLNLSTGEPTPDCSITVNPFMPDHSHPGSTASSLPGESSGTYLIDSVFFSMPGYWEIPSEITCGEETESATLGVCIDG